MVVYFTSNFLTSLTVGFRPLDTTLPSITKAGMLITLYFIISVSSSTFTTFASIPVSDTACITAV